MGNLANLFRNPDKVRPRVKALVFGASGVGKTYLALSAPEKIAMIDTEAGSSFYADRGLSPYDVMHTKTFKDVRDAVRTLAETKHDYQTLVIDPITTIWETLQDAAALARQKKRNSADEVDLELLDWSKLKRLYKSLLTDIVNLPMNVIVTAREKDELEKRGSDLVKVGYKPDAEKGTVYAFDSVIRLVATPEGRNAIILKDRTGSTAKVIENPTFATLFPFVGKESAGVERVTIDEQAAAETDETEVLTDIAGAELAAEARAAFAQAGIEESSVLTKKGWESLETAPATPLRAAIAWARNKK
jgi:hypothetical protein